MAEANRPLETAEAHARWRDLVSQIFPRLSASGVDEGDVHIMETPVSVRFGNWGDISLVLAKHGYQVVIRSWYRKHYNTTIDFDQPDYDLQEDILSCLGTAVRRKRRMDDTERTVQEMELMEMARMTGWELNGMVGEDNRRVRFRDKDDQVRGELSRLDLNRSDPARASFSLQVDVVALGYAETMRFLVDLRHVVDGKYNDRCDFKVPVLTDGAGSKKA